MPREKEKGTPMTNEKSGINGRVEWELRGPDGQIKDRGVQFNKVTDVGDAMYAKLGAGIASPPATPTGMKLGTGTTAAAKNGAASTLITYISGSNKAFDASFPAFSQTAGAGAVITYKRTYAAGEATNATINEAIICNDTIGTDANSAQANSISRVVFGSTINKASGDTLTVTWTHTLLGS
jgi:hypothetical protein